MKKSLMVLLLLLNSLFVSVQGEPPYPAYRISLVVPWTPPPSEHPRIFDTFALTGINNSGRIVGVHVSYWRGEVGGAVSYWYAGTSNIIGTAYFGGGFSDLTEPTMNNGMELVWSTPNYWGSASSFATVIRGGVAKSIVNETNQLVPTNGFYGSMLGSGVALDISDSGFVVGVQPYDFGGYEKWMCPFLWKPDQYVISIKANNAVSDQLGSAAAQAVNNHGWYVGYEYTSAFFGQGGLWTNLNHLTVTNSGWLLKNATDINDHGQIVGIGTTNGQEQAFLWEAGNVTGLGSLGTGAVTVAAINLQGQVVGTSAGRPFVWENGVMTDLNTLIPEDSGWVLTSATDINNHGEIIGMGNLGGYVLRPPSVMYFYPASEYEGGTNLTFTLDAHPGVTYVLESSTNFTSWLPILTNVTTSITNTVTIPEISASGAKYFRATLQP